MAFIIRTIRRQEQYLLPRRIARGLSHSLGAPVLLCWAVPLQRCMQSARNRAAGMVEPGGSGSRNVEPYSRIYR
jgi:hypothetical protein